MDKRLSKQNTQITMTSHELFEQSVAQLLSKTPKSDHLTPVLKKTTVQWQLGKDQIVFKLMLLIFKALNGTGSQLYPLTLKTTQPVPRT